MKHEEIGFNTIVLILWRYKYQLIIFTFLTLSLSVTAYLLTPKSYKVSSQFAIDPGFFKNPSVSDIVPEIHYAHEMRNKITSIVEGALGPKTMRELASRQNSGDAPLEEPKVLTPLQVTLFRGKFSLVSLSNGYQISVVDKSPSTALELNAEVLSILQREFKEARISRFIKAKEVISKQLDSLGGVLENSENDGELQELRKESELLALKLKELRRRFTLRHPKVTSLLSKKNKIDSKIEYYQSKKSPQSLSIYSRNIDPGGTVNQTMYGALISKLNNIDMTVELERGGAAIEYFKIINEPQLPISPFKPNKIHYLGGGLISGLFLTIITILISELRKQQEITPDIVAELLEVPVLGVLESMKTTHKQLAAPAAKTQGYLPESTA